MATPRLNTKTVCVPALWITLGVGYFQHVGSIPHGVFADEALIGLTAQRWLDGSQDLSLFYDHFGTISGSLTWLPAVPFIQLLGMSANSLRLTSVILMLFASACVYATLRNGGSHSGYATAALLCSPLFMHISRISFGHAPGFLCLALGYLLYTIARRSGSYWLACLAGAITALASLAYPGFFVAAAVFLGCVVFTEVIMAIRRYTSTAVPFSYAVGGLLGYAPVLWKASNEPNFLNRFRQKDNGESSLLSFDRFQSVIQNYPKYFSFDFLFRDGESGLPEAVFTRHSVVGTGLIPWIMLALLPAALLALPYLRNRQLVRTALPGCALVFAYPLPDALTTTPTMAPYAFSSGFGLLAVPFVAALGLGLIHQVSADVTERWNNHAWVREAHRWPLLLLSLLIPTMVFVFSTYPTYPWFSSGYYGWQNGVEEIAEYYEAHQAEYSALVIQYTIDQPETLLEFFMVDRSLITTVSRGLPDAGSLPAARTLYAIGGATFEGRYDPEIWHPQAIIENPDGTAAYYLVSGAPRLESRPIQSTFPISIHTEIRMRAQGAALQTQMQGIPNEPTIANTLGNTS